MNDNQNFSDEEEVVILVDEEGNEIIDDSFANEEFFEEPVEEVILEEDFELEQSFVKDEDAEDEEYDDGDVGFLGNVSSKFLYIFGGLIAVVAIFVGIFVIASRGNDGDVDFSMVGSEIAEIGVVGGENIRAIAAAKGSYIDDINEAIKAYDYNEADLEGGITSVDFSLQTILKDLKIKFVNSNDKLIASVPFEVEVTGPDGKTVTWTDTDKDGIIYQTDIAGGSYNIKLVKLSGYDTLYDFSKAGTAKSISVKTKLDYQKVDVKNEIKVQNSSNQAEDAVAKEIVVESKLKDTVSYVMSSKNQTAGYAEITKDSIIDPLATLTKTYEASIGRFKRLKGPVNVVDGEPGGNENPGGGTGSGDDGGAGSGDGGGTGSGDDGGTGSGDGGGTHICVFSGSWEKIDETQCAQKCTGCEKYGTPEKHDWDTEGKCKHCGFLNPEYKPEVKHDGNTHTTYSYTSIDENNHVKKCTFTDCSWSEKEGHSFDSNGKCVCGYQLPHNHSYGAPAMNKDGTHTYSCTNNVGKCDAPTVNENCSYLAASNGNKTHNKKCTKCGFEKQNEACTDSNGDNVCDICGASLKGTGSLTLADSSVKINGVVSLTPTPSVSNGFSVDAGTWAWGYASDADKAIVKLEDTNKQTAKVTGLKAGTATIRVSVKLNDKVTTLTKDIKVTVGGITITLDQNAKKALFIGGDDLKVTATTKGGTSNKCTWSVSDSSIAQISSSEIAKGDGTDGVNVVTVKGLKAGTVTLTATSVESKDIVKSITVVVATHPKNDTSTKLTDKNGKQVFVYDAASKTYREATYADYYKEGTKFFTPSDVIYTYTGWWTIDGKSYYFDSEGKKVTGDQVILGAKYSFDSDGVLKSGTGSFGIDVSTFNGTIDWSKVAKSGVGFAIIRCGLRGSTAGALYEDSKFATNIKNATDAGVKVGLYFFTQAITEAEAVEEASMCLTLAENYKISYPIFIDVESATNGRANSLSKEDRTKIVNAFCKTVSNGGYKAGIYANKTWFTNNLDVSQLSSYVIWLAQYASTPTYTASRYDLWQYSSEGSMSGISGKVDLDLSYLGY